MKSQDEIPIGFSSTTSKDDITNKVKGICNLTGIVGISAAVIHEGEVVWKESIGYSDRDKETAVTPNTVYPLGALSQSFTAAVVAQMAHRNILHYNDKVSDHLGSLIRPWEKEAADENTTIGDLLGHRTGYQAAESLLTGYGGRVPLREDYIIHIYYHLKRQAERRSKFIHSAINYIVLGEVVGQYCPEGYGKYLETNILKPLGMSHTTNIFIERPEDDRSQLYYVGRQGEQLQSQFVDSLDSVLAPDYPEYFRDADIPLHDYKSLYTYCRKQLKECIFAMWPRYDENDSAATLAAKRIMRHRIRQARSEQLGCLQRATMPNSARGMSSTVNDLIKYCIGLNMAADKSQDPAPEHRGCKRAFPDADLLLSPLQDMDGASSDETIKNKCSYAAGWATCTLPGRLEGLGMNSKLVSMPVIGMGQTKASKVYWNQGVHCGANSFVALLPETKSAVIVLTNTRTANDAADWIGQLLLQTLLGGSLSLFPVQVSIDSAYKQHEDVFNRLVKANEPGIPRSRSFNKYAGIYATSNRIEVLIIWPEVYQGTKALHDSDPNKGKNTRAEMTVQFLNNKKFLLWHLSGESFTWCLDWDGMMMGHQSTGLPLEHYILHFDVEADTLGPASVTWWHDPGMSKAETFHRLD